MGEHSFFARVVYKEIDLRNIFSVKGGELCLLCMDQVLCFRLKYFKKLENDVKTKEHYLQYKETQVCWKN